MKTTLFAILSLITSNSFSQSKYTKGSWFFGVNYSPEIAYRDYLHNNVNDLNGYSELRQRVDIPKFGTTANASIGYELKDWLFIEAGLGYSMKGYQTKKYKAEGYQPGYINPQYYSHKFNYHYIDIPIKASILYGDGRLRLVGAISFTTNFLAAAVFESKDYYDDGSVISIRSRGKFDVNLTLAISSGLDYLLTEKTTIRLEPTFRYSMLRTDASHLWNGGANIGIYHAL